MSSEIGSPNAAALVYNRVSHARNMANAARSRSDGARPSNKYDSKLFANFSWNGVCSLTLSAFHAARLSTPNQLKIALVCSRARGVFNVNSVSK